MIGDGGGLIGDGGGFIGIGCHKLFKDSPLIGDDIGHVVHIIINFVQDVRGGAGE